MGEPEAPAPRGAADVYFLLVAASNLVTALVPSETACWTRVSRTLSRRSVCVQSSSFSTTPCFFTYPLA